MVRLIFYEHFRVAEVVRSNTKVLAQLAQRLARWWRLQVSPTLTYFAFLRGRQYCPTRYAGAFVTVDRLAVEAVWSLLPQPLNATPNTIIAVALHPRTLCASKGESIP